jgi:hypothetical protein
MSHPSWYTRRMIMNEENIYRVTIGNGPLTSIMPIKARDVDHAIRIAKGMRLGRVIKVQFDCVDDYS